MRNPIHKRLERLDSWQHITFMACLCERMAPNFQLFCQLAEKEDEGRVYQNILNLVWEFLTVKDARINFDSQLEKLEEIIPSTEDYDFYAVLPAQDACEGLAELLHALIAGFTLERAIEVSQLSVKTLIELLEIEQQKEFNENELKEMPEIEQEFDVQWQIFRALKSCEERDIDLILDLKKELRESGISNIGIESKQ